MRPRIAVSFKIFTLNFERATILGHMVDDISSFYDLSFSPATQFILHIIAKKMFHTLQTNGF